MLFPTILALLFLIVLWQSITYIRTPQGHPLRKNILVRLTLLFLVIGIATYAWRSAIDKEREFLELLLPYPGAVMDMSQTPVFSDDPYWTYAVNATPDQIFNWYRSRAKHAGWLIGDEVNPDARVFVVVVPVRISIFVVLKPEGGRTTITYTTEGMMMRESAKK